MADNDQRFESSFRGVPALTQRSSDKKGKNTVVHEFPGRPPRIDQNGPMPVRFTEEFIFIGATYQQDLFAFEAALEDDAAGTFVHHWRGSFLAKPEGEYEVQWSTDEGGMARLTATFVVAGEEDGPTQRVETFDLVITEADIANARMADMVEEDFTVAGSNNLRERGTSILEDAVATITSANASVQAQFNGVNSTSTQIATLGSQLERLINTPHTMATTVAGLVDSVVGAVTRVVTSVGEIDPVADGDEVLSALLRSRRVLVAMGLFRDGTSFGDGYSEGAQNTPQQRQRVLNQRRLVHMMRIAFVTATCRTVAALDVESSTQATDVYEQVAEAIESLSGDVDDNTYRALANLRAALGAHLRVSAAKLPDVVEYTPGGTLPTLLLAQQLYGDPRRAEEIAERNSIVHPGFVPGGVAIEVLSA